MNENLQGRITGFFDFWRERYTFIRNLNFIQNHYEANVLLWASLDALSNCWLENIGKDQCSTKSKRVAFDIFLARYGGDLFQLVSLPDVWNRIDRGDIYVNPKIKLKLPENICIFLSEIGRHRTPTVKEENQTRSVSDDWSMDRIITDSLISCPATNQIELKEWLTLSQYGAIAYKQMRNAYIHEGQLEGGAHDFPLYGSERQPTYRSAIYATPPIIGFRIEFMLGVLWRCIHAFEDEANALEKDPVPEK